MIDKEQFKKDLKRIIDQGNQFIDDVEIYVKKYEPYKDELKALKDDPEFKDLFKKSEELADRLNGIL